MRKVVNPVNAALEKKGKVRLSADTAECKYCGKLYHSGIKLTEHINKEHTGEQTIYSCPCCTQPFNQYSEYLEHLGELGGLLGPRMVRVSGMAETE